MILRVEKEEGVCKIIVSNFIISLDKEVTEEKFKELDYLNWKDFSTLIADNSNDLDEVKKVLNSEKISYSIASGSTIDLTEKEKLEAEMNTQVYLASKSDVLERLVPTPLKLL